MKITIWDQIYKDFQNGGQAWATLEGGLEQHFKEFVEHTDFPKKWAFDIGYGTGQYLQYMKLKGFAIFGIDSSPTAHEMAEKSLGFNIGLLCGDMYKHKLPKNTYGLVLSISTIHHGTKDKIEKILSSIYESLVYGGYAYITLPIHDSSHYCPKDCLD
jgi:SAM-dependent methyltransferase